MGDQNSSCGGTQIDDLPSCLITDILLRLPVETLVNSKFVCKTWFLSAPSQTRLLRRRSELKSNIRCYKSVGPMAGKDFEFEMKVVRIPDSTFMCYNSYHGLLCLSKANSVDEIYVWNPILGEYITIPALNKGSILRIRSVLGFCSRSNQFKVLQISLNIGPSYMAEIYTIGNGTRQWRKIGIAPSCTSSEFPDGSSFLNGSIHWPDGLNHQIVYFDFEREQFGSLPAPPAWHLDGRWSDFSLVRVGVLDGCLCIYAFSGRALLEKWVMKEYGVEESWTDIFSTHNNNNNNVELERWGTKTTYIPSFVSLQDVAKSEDLTVLSKTRTKDEDSPEGISNISFSFGSENAYEEAAGE